MERQIKFNELNSAVKPLTYKIWLERFLKAGIFIGFLTVLIGLCVAVTRLITPLPNLYRYVFYFLPALVLAGIVVAILSRPKLHIVYKAADNMGLRERCITAYELRGESTEFAALQRADALQAAKSADYKQYKLNVNKKLYIVIVLLLGAIAASAFIKTPATIEAEAIERLYDLTDSITEEVQNLQDELEKSKLDAERKEIITQKLEELKKQLQESKTPEEAAKALARAKNAIADLQSESESATGESESVGEFGSDETNDILESLSEAQSQLKQLQTQSGDSVLSDSSGNSQGQGVQGEANGEGKGEGEPNGSGEGNGENNQGDGSESGQNGDGSDGESQGNSGGSDSNSPDGSDSQGQGNKQGNNREGSQGQGSGWGQGEFYEKQFESLYVPRRLGGDSDPDYVSGELQDSGSSSIQNSDELRGAGSLVPYNQVINEYKQEALTSIDSRDIPVGMKDVVRDYFASMG